MSKDDSRKRSKPFDTIIRKSDGKVYYDPTKNITTGGTAPSTYKPKGIPGTYKPK